jgi:hypothetical protein
MNTVVEPLTSETLTRLSQAAQMSLYLIGYTEHLSASAVDWAKQMSWLQEPWMTAAAAQYGSGLNGRTREVSAVQAEIFRTLRTLEDKLATLLDTAATCGDTAATLLGRLGTKLPERSTPFAEARYPQLSIDAIVAEMAENVLETCVRLQSQGNELEAAMRRLPELQCA